ncbi:hypothetical protein D3C74_343400 [compost metagenome]
MQHAARAARGAFLVELGRDLERVRVDRDDRVDLVVVRLDPVEVHLRELDRGQLARGHGLLDVHRARLEQREGAVVVEHALGQGRDVGHVDRAAAVEVGGCDAGPAGVGARGPDRRDEQRQVVGVDRAVARQVGLGVEGRAEREPR